MTLVKTILFLILILIPIATTSRLYGFLESSANLIESLLETEETAGTALMIGGPFILMFVALFVGIFVVVPLAICCIVAFLGGRVLRCSSSSVSKRLMLAVTVLAALLTGTFVSLASQYGDFMLASQPEHKPQTPTAVFACLAGFNAALSVFIAICIVRFISSYRRKNGIKGATSRFYRCN